MKITLFLFFNIIVCLQVYCQQEDSAYIKKGVANGDSIFIVQSEPLYILNPNNKNDVKISYDRHTRLIYNLRIVYPYAVLIRKKLEEINHQLSLIESDKDRKEYIKSQEKNLFSQYEAELTDLTVSQGRLLMKLVDRETKRTTYDLIKEYKGNISAVFWQSIARLFGSNLKSNYDPYGEDQLIEELLILMEKGML